MTRRKDGIGGTVVAVMLTLLVVAVLVMAGYISYVLVTRFLETDPIRDGFEAGDLLAPASITLGPDKDPAPEFIRGGPAPPSIYSISFPVNSTTKAIEAYEGIGGVLNLSLSNTGTTALYVEYVTIETGWGSSDRVPIERRIDPGSERHLMHRMVQLPDPVPGTAELDFDIVIDILVGPLIGDSIWTRREGVRFDSNPIQVAPLAEPIARQDLLMNRASIYDRVVPDIREELNDLTVVAMNISDDGEFSISDVVDAALFLGSRLEYISDSDPSDEWLSPMETLSRGGGDCEDWSALYAGLITAMGGSARIVLSDRHVVCSVFIGEDDTVLADVQGMFGTNVPLLVHEDDLGCWLVVDPQGGPVFGWFPLNTLPSRTGAEGMSIYGYDGLSWRFTDTDSIYMVDIYI